MVNKIKQLLNHENKKIKTLTRFGLFFSIVVLLGVTGAFTIHTVDQAIAGSEEVSVDLDHETREDYKKQILDFIQYDSPDKLSWDKVKEKRGNHYVHIFDGYTTNIFRFSNGKLTHYGTRLNGDLIPIKDL